MIVLDVIGEIRGARWVALLTELGAFADTIGFVVQGAVASPESLRLISRLEPDKLSDADRSQWPGTRLIQGQARVLEFRATPSVIAAIAAFADGLFDWPRTLHPEDLFLRAGDTLVLETVGHERLAFVRVKELPPSLHQLLGEGAVAVHSASD